MTANALRARTFVCFTVPGTPVAQGSMVIMKGHIRHSDDKRLVAWRNEIAARCREEMRRPMLVEPLYKPWTGPVELLLAFVYKPRKSAEGDTPKITAPDLDKLSRAVLDALSGVLYEDDRQVVKIEAYKRYGDWVSAYDGGPEETMLVVNAAQVLT